MGRVRTGEGGGRDGDGPGGGGGGSDGSVVVVVTGSMLASRSHRCPFYACAHTSDGVCQSNMLWADIDRTGGCCRAELRRGREVLVAPPGCPTASTLPFFPVIPVFPRADVVDVLRPISIRPTRLCMLSSITRLVRRVNSGRRIAGPVPLAGGANGCLSLSVMAAS